MQDLSYLTTEEAAAYLRLKERKLYELAASGAAPCSKVTGKWLFPRAALDRWIEAGMSRPVGVSPAAPPPIIGGSHDPLLEWATRRSGSGLALLSEGSEAGVERLGANRVAVAAIHLHDLAGDSDANVEVMGARPDFHDGVLIAFARREQGLVLAPGNPQRIESLSGAVRAGAVFGLRQKGAGAQQLLDRLLASEGMTARQLKTAPGVFATGQDLAQAIRAGEVDCGVATRAVAVALGLAFAPLAWERFDLAMRRRTYFEPSLQALIALMRSSEFARQAQTMTGYDVSDAAAVRLNR